MRTTLYLTAMSSSKPLVRLEEIAQSLGIPRHFLAKILKRSAKEGVLVAVKGLNSHHTLQTPLLTILELTGLVEKAGSCLLLQGKCDEEKPCPLHQHAAPVKNDWVQLLSETTIGLLLNKEQPAAVQMAAGCVPHHD